MNAHEAERAQRWLLRKVEECKVSLPYSLGKDGHAAILFEMAERDPGLRTRWHRPTRPGTDWYLSVNFLGIDVWVGGWPHAEAEVISARLSGSKDPGESATPGPFAYA
jgi:hypothetical protein